MTTAAAGYNWGFQVLSCVYNCFFQVLLWVPEGGEHQKPDQVDQKSIGAQPRRSIELCAGHHPEPCKFNDPHHGCDSSPAENHLSPHPTPPPSPSPYKFWSHNTAEHLECFERTANRELQWERQKRNVCDERGNSRRKRMKRLQTTQLRTHAAAPRLMAAR